ncbi:MAG: hypothetical protein ACREVX_09325 [Clostridium sp.]|uniref:hypothetical protein n=1 Tax=Clostridium sp. TaxID=1506 RepID=UPI003D6CAF1E
MKNNLLLLVSIALFIYCFWGLIGFNNKDIITKLEGQIYYTKRVDSVLTLYKSNANLENEKLVYSHLGKGKNQYGTNDNIIDFYYDIKSDSINFVAMNEDWQLYSLEKGTINEYSSSNISKTDYINNHAGSITAIQKKGSIFLVENGKEKCVKKFYGIYDKFTGYSPVGFSPDGKYLIYYSMGHLTSVGSILEGMITGSCGHNWIMDLDTGKSARFVDSNNTQWIMK